MGQPRRRRRLAVHRRCRRRRRRSAAAPALDTHRGQTAAQSVRERSTVPRHHRHGASSLRLRPISVFPRALSGTDRAPEAGAVSAAVTDRPGLVGQAGPGSSVAGQPRRMAGYVPCRRPDETDGPGAQIRDERLECSAPRPLRGLGVSAASGDQPEQLGYRIHRRGVHARRTAAASPITRHRYPTDAGPRLPVHYPRSARAVASRLVGCTGAPWPVRRAFGRALRVGADISRRRLNGAAYAQTGRSPGTYAVEVASDADCGSDAVGSTTCVVRGTDSRPSAMVAAVIAVTATASIRAPALRTIRCSPSITTPNSTATMGSPTSMIGTDACNAPA